MAFCPEHPKWDQNPKFIPLSETTSIPTPFICGVPHPGYSDELIILLKVNIEVKCVYLKELKHLNANSM